MYICTHRCVRMYICTHMCECVCTYVRIGVCVCTYVRICVCVCASPLSVLQRIFHTNRTLISDFGFSIPTFQKC
jgi:hypothetical protein